MKIIESIRYATAGNSSDDYIPDSSSDTHVPVVTAYRRTLRLSLTSSPTTFQTRSEDSPKRAKGVGEGVKVNVIKIILLDLHPFLIPRFQTEC